MAEPGFNYIEPDCCGNCRFNQRNDYIVTCRHEKQLSLPENEMGGSGYFRTNILFVNHYGKCDLHKRKPIK